MGPTRVFRARHMAPDSIRGSFGLTDTRNTTHGSGESCSEPQTRKDVLGFVGLYGEVDSHVPSVSFLPIYVSGPL